MSPLSVAARAILGATAGLTIVRWSARSDVPTWWMLYVALVLALALVVAPGVDAWAGRGLNSGWALATACGLYLGVPETDRIVSMAPVLAIIWLAELTGRMRVDALVVAALDIVLVCAAVRGATNRTGALVAGVALLGLLVVAPALTLIRPTTPPRVFVARDIVILLALQLAFVVVVARVGGVRTTASEAATVVALAVPVLALAAAPLVVPRENR